MAEPPGQPVVVEMTPKAARRLAAAYYAKEGAKAAAQGAVVQAQILEQKYQEMLAAELDDVEMPPNPSVDHNLETGVIAVKGGAP